MNDEFHIISNDLKHINIKFKDTYIEEISTHHIDVINNLYKFDLENIYKIKDNNSILLILENINKFINKYKNH